MCINIYIYMIVCIYACIYTRVCIYIYIYIYTYIYIYIYALLTLNICSIRFERLDMIQPKLSLFMIRYASIKRFDMVQSSDSIKRLNQAITSSGSIKRFELNIKYMINSVQAIRYGSIKRFDMIRRKLAVRVWRNSIFNCALIST